MFFLVDFENINENGLVGIETLTENDNVMLFYSKVSCKISFTMHNQIIFSKANIEYFEIQNGSNNALDFQLSTYLGYLIANN